MQPVSVLMNEHRTIERVLDALDRAAGHLARGGAVRPGFFADAVTFLAGYADRRHHHKEEDLLFPALTKAGLPSDGGPVAVMLHEHVRGRELIASIRVAAGRLGEGDRDVAGRLVNAARAYVGLLRDHIMKEDHVLFPMAAQWLSPEAARALAADFDRAVSEEEAAERVDRYGELATALAGEAAALT